MSISADYDASFASSPDDLSLDLIPANFDPEAHLYSQDSAFEGEGGFSSPIEEIVYPILETVSTELTSQETLPVETWDLRDIQRLAPLDLAMTQPKLKDFQKRVVHPLDPAMESRGTLVCIISKDKEQKSKDSNIRSFDQVTYTHSIVF